MKEVKKAVVKIDKKEKTKMGSFQEDLAFNKQNFESKLDGKMSYYYAPYHKMSEADKKKVN